MDWKAPDLAGRVAVVTGASRGVGRGIAHELGSAGTTVYVTGRSTAGATTEGRAETLEDTARLVDEAGGEGVAVRCDHTVDAEVAALAERVRRERGRLDLLVNNVWGGYERYDPAEFEQPFWEQPLDRWDRMMRAGLRAHYAASRALVPLMLPQRRGLVVSTSAGDRGAFLGDVQYDVAKAAVARLAMGMAFQRRPWGIAALVVQPGFTRTERVLDEFAKAGQPPPPDTHSPRFVGRAVACLAADPRVLERAGKAWRAGELGLAYGFPDTDGSRPGPWSMPADHLRGVEQRFADLAAEAPRGG